MVNLWSDLQWAPHFENSDKLLEEFVYIISLKTDKLTQREMIKYDLAFTNRSSDQTDTKCKMHFSWQEENICVFHVTCTAER